MSDHRIDLSITGPDITAELVCTAPIGADCRVACAENCGAETWPCFSYDPEKDEWIDNSDGTIEHHSDESHELISGPIVFEWDGNDYTWRYES